MSFRYMRLILFYDLPTVTKTEKSIASRFRRDLIKEGFIMLQESVYCKLVLNEVVAFGVKNRLEKIKPREGNIMLMKVTEKQFNSIELLIGNLPKKIIDKTERLIIL